MGSGLDLFSEVEAKREGLAQALTSMKRKYALLQRRYEVRVGGRKQSPVLHFCCSAGPDGVLRLSLSLSLSLFLSLSFSLSLFLSSSTRVRATGSRRSNRPTSAWRKRRAARPTSPSSSAWRRATASFAARSRSCSARLIARRSSSATCVVVGHCFFELGPRERVVWVYLSSMD